MLHIVFGISKCCANYLTQSVTYSVSVGIATVDDLYPIKYCLFIWGINSWEEDKHTSEVECDLYCWGPLVNW